MVGYDTKEESEYKVSNYNICRFMIKQEAQGKELGKAAFAKLLDYLMTFPQGEAEYIYLSYEPNNLIAKNLYSAFGFCETGELDYDEVIARLKI